MASSNERYDEANMILNLIKKMVKYVGIIVVVLLVLSLFPAFLVYRKYLQYRITKRRNKRLKDGINILEPINIGGIQQWISVRGENTENPLLLILHGGPGFSMMPYSSIFDSLESNFIIVQWDQRGAGKTYAVNQKSPPLSETITIEQMQADTLEVVNHLRHRFKKEKIFVLGHSWGSILGLKLAQDHSELLHAYIGVGQFINTKVNERIGYDNALKVAYEKNNKKAIKALESLTLYRSNDISLNELFVLRKWQFHLNGILIKKSMLFSIIINALSATEYSLLDYLKLIRGLFSLSKSKTMFTEILNIALEDKTNFSTPIFIFGGRKDPVTPSLPIHEYFNKIKAPYKEYIWFENSGHNLFFEETDKFVKCLFGVSKFHTLNN